MVALGTERLSPLFAAVYHFEPEATIYYPERYRRHIFLTRRYKILQSLFDVIFIALRGLWSLRRRGCGFRLFNGSHGKVGEDLLLDTFCIVGCNISNCILGQQIIGGQND